MLHSNIMVYETPE
jgi:hypothetical protein